jgi:hypothetical protein
MCLLISLFSRFSQKIVEAIVKLVSDSLVMSMLLLLTWPNCVSQVCQSALSEREVLLSILLTIELTKAAVRS